MVALARDVVAHPDAWQYERARRFGLSAQGIHYALRRLGVTCKKNAHASKEVRGRAFQTMIKMYEHRGRPLVYIDESGFARDMPRTHGSAPTGQRCDGVCDWQARGRTNAIGALIGKALLTVGLFQANVNAGIFTAWVKQDLLPRLPENSVIVMDNATVHKLCKISSEKQGIPCSCGRASTRRVLDTENTSAEVWGDTRSESNEKWLAKKMLVSRTQETQG